jgi:hypothetical protein
MGDNSGTNRNAATSQKLSDARRDRKMTNSKNYGERVPFKKSFTAHIPMGAAEWKKVEDVSGLKLEPEKQDRIQLFNDLYSSVGPLYSGTQSVLAKTAKKEIKAWRAATGRLWRALSPEDKDLAELMPDVENGVFPNLSGLTPVGIVAFVALFAKVSSESAIDFLSDGHRNGRIQNDLWAAWACLTTRVLVSAGLKVTRASADWSGTPETPYVKTMQTLQSFLPVECHHYSTPESMLNGAKQANEQFEKLAERTLLQILAGWGTQLLPNYPGALLKSPSGDLAAFDDFAMKTLDEAARRSSES